jgi:GT2 family glycosyltransferase
LALVSIITVNYNQLQHTCALLDSIRQQHSQDIEVIVVDNASKENPEAFLKAHYPEVKFIRSVQNLGFAGGNNLGIGLATGQYLFFVNNDTELTYFCIDRLLHFIQQTPDCGAVSPLICYYNLEVGTPDVIQYAGMTPVSRVTARNEIIGEGEKDAGQFLTPQRTAYAHGAAMMVPRAVLDAVGGMYEGFFLYYEELDWCERIRRAGYTIWVNPLARIYHKESATVGRHSPLKSYFMHRNRLLFVKRNYPRTRVPFYIYMWMVVYPKALFKFIADRDFARAKAVSQAYFWHFYCIRNDYEKMVPFT